MKRITLSETAYQRLRSWKESEEDTFTSVVLRKIPPRGTMGALANAFDQLPPLSEASARLMEEAVAWGNKYGLVESPLLTDRTLR